jgi:hypothetical protein
VAQAVLAAMMPVPALAPTSKKSIKELARGFDKIFGEKKKKKNQFNQRQSHFIPATRATSLSFGA